MGVGGELSQAPGGNLGSPKHQRTAPEGSPAWTPHPLLQIARWGAQPPGGTTAVSWAQAVPSPPHAEGQSPARGFSWTDGEGTDLCPHRNVAFSSGPSFSSNWGSTGVWGSQMSPQPLCEGTGGGRTQRRAGQGFGTQKSVVSGPWLRGTVVAEGTEQAPASSQRC